MPIRSGLRRSRSTQAPAKKPDEEDGQAAGDDQERHLESDPRRGRAARREGPPCGSRPSPARTRSDPSTASGSRRVARVIELARASRTVTPPSQWRGPDRAVGLGTGGVRISQRPGSTGRPGPSGSFLVSGHRSMISTNARSVKDRSRWLEPGHHWGRFSPTRDHAGVRLMALPNELIERRDRTAPFGSPEKGLTCPPSSAPSASPRARAPPRHRRRRPRGPGGRGVRVPGPERRRQDDHDPDAARPHPADLGPRVRVRHRDDRGPGRRSTAASATSPASSRSTTG